MNRFFLLLSCFLFLTCEPPQVRYDIPGPTPKTPEPVIERLPEDTPSSKFIVLGDWGGGNPWRIGSEYRQQQVADGMATMLTRRDRGLDYVVGTGDNFYNRGVKDIHDRKWRIMFEEVYDKARFPMLFYMVLGNHDYGKNPLAQVAYHQLENHSATGRWYMPKRYYTFTDTVSEDTDIQFFGLDTQMLIEDGWYLDYKERVDGPDNESEAQMAWLTQELKASQARWKVVFMHHPMYSNGNHGDTEWLIKHVKPLLEQYGVQVVFAGHDHNLEAIRPVNGIHYFVSGAGANALDVTWREDTLFAYADNGFIWCRVTKDDFLVVLCNKDGKALWAETIKWE